MSIRGRKPPYFQPSHFSRKRLDLVSTDFWLFAYFAVCDEGTECERSTFALSFKAFGALE